MSLPGMRAESENWRDGKSRHKEIADPLMQDGRLGGQKGELVVLQAASPQPKSNLDVISQKRPQKYIPEETLLKFGRFLREDPSILERRKIRITQKI